MGTLEQQILQTNPVLEAFGNAQTVRNNNSSRFGKFIRIEFSPSGQIAGANIERYLLEKSRVTHQSSKERNYHIFYQLMKGASAELKQQLLLDGSLNDYAYVKKSNKNVEGIDDAHEFRVIQDGLKIVGFKDEDKMNLFRVIAAIMHLGNITVVADRDDQAQITDFSAPEKVCHLLGVPVKDFVQGLVKPLVKAGREWVVSSRTPDQVHYSLDALAKAMYERMFTKLVEQINTTLDTPKSKSNFIGVLDIAGFEIFEVSFLFLFFL